MSDLLVEIRGLSVRFGQTRIIDDLDFSIQANEILALVGESGCGKSTVALSLLRLLPRKGCVVTGQIRVDGTDILSLSEKALSDLRGNVLSIIFQDPLSALNPVWSVGSQITETLRRHTKLSAGAARRRAIELLDLVAIAEPHRRIDDFPHQFSGGMRQRVMIAIAIACNPRLLIADEPTTALDVTTQAQVLELLDGLRRDMGMSVLLITHDLSLVSDWADRTIVMYGGQICETAPTRALFSAPRHPYTRHLLSAIPSLTDELTHRNGRLFEMPDNGRMEVSSRGCRFAHRCNIAEPTCASIKPALQPLGTQAHLVACPLVQPKEAHALAFV